MSFLLTTFGTPSLSADGLDVRLNHKELALLVYLRVTGRAHTRGSIGELLWANVKIQRNTSVNTAVSNLRCALPKGVIVSNTRTVELTDGLHSDLDAALENESSTDSFIRSLEIRAAPFMDGFEFQLREGADAFIDWMLQERARFASELNRHLEERCAEAAARRDWTTVHTLAMAGTKGVPAWSTGAQWLDKSSRGRRKSRVGGLVASAVVVGIAIMTVLSGNAGRRAAPPCGAGEAHAQLVRQIYPAEANLALRPGESYTPTFILKNVGSCTWGRGTHIVRTSGFGPASLSGAEARRTIGKPVLPDSVAEIPIRLVGPEPPGRYGEDWRLLDVSGRPLSIEGGMALELRFQVLPKLVRRCGPGEPVAELLAQSPPRKDYRIRPGGRLLTSWTIANRGSCAWDSALALRFQRASGLRLSSDSVSEIHIAEAVIPSNAYTFQVPLRAPARDGSYLESWTLLGPDGRLVPVSDAPAVDVRIVVTRGGEIRSTASVCGSGKSVAGFLNSERVADGSTISPGATVPKEWTLLNRGDCTWPAGMRLEFARSTPALPGTQWPRVTTTREVPPQDTYTFPAPFQAPVVPRHYRVHWRLRDPAGDSIRISSGYTVWADFDVRGSMVRGDGTQAHEGPRPAYRRSPR